MGPHGEFRASGVLVGLFVAALWFAGVLLALGSVGPLGCAGGFPAVLWVFSLRRSLVGGRLGIFGILTCCIESHPLCRSECSLRCLHGHRKL